eukprot:m.11606 g.11606  ORF g.11606 m.11606 type:complete len:462 (+) comp4488_c0_seq2:346-1731(+)
MSSRKRRPELASGKLPIHLVGQKGEVLNENSEQTNVKNLCVRKETEASSEASIPGDLIFDASFESGNLGKVQMVSSFEYDLFIRPDTKNFRHRIWFFFSVSNCVQGQTVVFNIVNFSKAKSLYRKGMAPVVKSESNVAWTRLHSENVFYYKCPRRQRGYVMSFVFKFEKPEKYEFAYSFPYTYSKLQRYLGRIERKRLPFCKRERVCPTIQQRRLDMLTITDPVNIDLDADNNNRERPIDVVFITARVHPGETPASLMCEGLINFLLSDEAANLRKEVIFKIVPMLNPDGVYVGNYRSSVSGYDLNRCWQFPKDWAHPTIVAVKGLLTRYSADPKYNLRFYLDLHAHTTNQNSFLYGNYYADRERMMHQKVFPNIMAAFCDDFSESNTDFNAHKVKEGTGRRTVSTILDPKAIIYTLEVSCHSYISKETQLPVQYSEEDYMRTGYGLGLSLKAFYVDVLDA